MWINLCLCGHSEHFSKTEYLYGLTIKIHKLGKRRQSFWSPGKKDFALVFFNSFVTSLQIFDKNSYVTKPAFDAFL